MGSTEPALRAPLRFARLTSKAGLLTKTISLDTGGGLTKKTAAQLSRGHVLLTVRSPVSTHGTE